MISYLKIRRTGLCFVTNGRRRKVNVITKQNTHCEMLRNAESSQWVFVSLSACDDNDRYFTATFLPLTTYIPCGKVFKPLTVSATLTPVRV